MAYIVPPTFTSGAILTAAQMTILGNDILAGGPIYATTAARDVAIPAPFVGQQAFVTADLINYQYSGTAWVEAVATGAWGSWTPAIFQNGARTSTNTVSRVTRQGRLIIATSRVTITAAGSAGSIISCTIPFAAQTPGSDLSCGTFIYFQTSGTRHVGTVLLNNSFGASPGILFHANANNALGSAPSFATANGDVLTLQITYEAAS